MKKAVIKTGGKQYLVAVGDEIEVERLQGDKKSVDFPVLLVVDEKKVAVGQPVVDGAKVTAEIIEPEIKAEKVMAIRYKAKKRVKKLRGHRHIHSLIKIKTIS